MDGSDRIREEAACFELSSAATDTLYSLLHKHGIYHMIVRSAK